MPQSIFKRYEKKYILTRDKANSLLRALDGRLQQDVYGAYTVHNIYYDTDNYDLIRMSIDKPVYKEKLRMRSYGAPGDGSPVFLELKKKYDGVVYKRRVALESRHAGELLRTGLYSTRDRQILNEIRYFLSMYPVREKVLICYDRTALRGVEDGELRITFDANIRFRQSALRLDQGSWGADILAPGEMVMEIKVPGVFPVWLSRALSELSIFPASYSKYGAVYKNWIAGAPDTRGGVISA